MYGHNLSICRSLHFKVGPVHSEFEACISPRITPFENIDLVIDTLIDLLIVCNNNSAAYQQCVDTKQFIGSCCS